MLPARTRRGTVAAVVGTLGLLLLAHGLGPAPRAGAQAPPSPAWEPTRLAGPVLQLYPSGSGVFYARTADAFQRSDDGGLTWTPRTWPFPPGYANIDRYSLALTPTDSNLLYAAGPDGLR